ncbi:MAG: hypothetical protein AB1297_06200 [bacterium]
MKRLIWGLLLIGCGGCFFTFGPTEGPPKEFDTSYTIIVQSDDAREITLYLPFPHYKGKPDMRYLKWLREDLGYKQKWYASSFLKSKIDLIDTEYGKMLYIYIPKKEPTGVWFKLEIGKHGGSSQPIKINRKTVVDDYKLTGEDRIKPEREWENPNPSYKWHIFKSFNMPIYAHFEGKELILELYYSITGYKWFSMFDGPAQIIYLDYGYPRLKEEDKFVVIKSGWQKMLIEKMSHKKEEMIK